MIKTLFFLSLGFVCCKLNAQIPVLTATTTAQAIGQTFAYSVQFVETGNVSIGVGGANQVWDYSGLKDSGAAINVSSNIISPLTTPYYATHFPSANIASTSDDNSYSYNEITANYSHVLGSVDSSGYITKYSPYRVTLQFPFTYNSSFVSDYTTTRTTTTNPNPSIKYYTTDSVFAEGYGTLLLPAGKSYSNVLRVKTITNDTLVIASAITFITKRTLIAYYSPNFKYGLMTFVTATQEVLGTTTSTTLVSYTKNTALPVTLLNFNAIQQNNQVFTNWQTTNEVNASHFIIERSTDGSSFTAIGKVNAKGGGDYSYTDNQLPAATIIYYRLQMVDKDGSYTYSKTVAVPLIIHHSPLTLYPNPVKETLFVQLTANAAETATLQITDMQGKVLQQQTQRLAIGTTSISVNTSNLAKGSYVIVVKGQIVQQKQFVKE